LAILNFDQQLNYFIKEVDFEKGNGLVPVIVQNKLTGQVLMLGYMNEEAVKKTIQTKRVHFWSRSRKTIWLKGETSGNYALVDEITIDCDNDTLLCKVVPTGPICHKGTTSCFSKNSSSIAGASVEIIEDIYNVMVERTLTPSKESYVARMVEKGLERISRKIGEEAIELIFAGQTDNESEIVHEATDVLFHVMLLLVSKGIPINKIYEELYKRHQEKTDKEKRKGS